MGEWGKYLMIIIISADGEERGVDRLDGEGRFDPRSVEGGREVGGGLSWRPETEVRVLKSGEPEGHFQSFAVV